MTLPNLHELTQDKEKYDEVCKTVAYVSAKMSGKQLWFKGSYTINGDW